jgi:hypothetical protein
VYAHTPAAPRPRPPVPEDRAFPARAAARRPVLVHSGLARTTGGVPRSVNRADFRGAVRQGPPPGLFALRYEVAVGWGQLAPARGAARARSPRPASVISRCRSPGSSTDVERAEPLPHPSLYAGQLLQNRHGRWLVVPHTCYAHCDRVVALVVVSRAGRVARCGTHDRDARRCFRPSAAAPAQARTCAARSLRPPASRRSGCFRCSNESGPVYRRS